MKNRRNLVKVLSIGGTLGAVEVWKKPMVESVLLPVHAQTSCVTTNVCSGRGCSPPVDISVAGDSSGSEVLINEFEGGFGIVGGATTIDGRGNFSLRESQSLDPISFEVTVDGIFSPAGAGIPTDRYSGTVSFTFNFDGNFVFRISGSFLSTNVKGLGDATDGLPSGAYVSQIEGSNGEIVVCMRNYELFCIEEPGLCELFESVFGPITGAKASIQSKGNWDQFWKEFKRQLK